MTHNKSEIIKVMEKIDEVDKKVVIFWAFLVIFLFGVIDYMSMHPLNFMPFYFVPIALLAWFVNKRAALVGSVTATALWFTNDLLYGIEYRNAVAPYWGMFTRMFFYTIVTFLLSALGREMQKQKTMASTDYLTKLDNRRSFSDKLRIEIQRAIRHKHPVTMVYMDVDDFKKINDKYGHDGGDSVLIRSAAIMKKSIRITDIAARMGGDEFALFMPEMDIKEAKKFVEKMKERLKKEGTNKIKRATFSFGVTSYKRLNGNMTVKQLVKNADHVMYSVKKKGKNAILFKEF